MAIKIYKTKLFRRLSWLVLGIAIIVVLIAAVSKSNNAVCKDIKVNIKGSDEHSFITAKGILKQINAVSIINTIPIKNIDIKVLENQLRQNVWVDEVDVYFTKNQLLQIDITQRVPLYRIFTKNGNSFYLDNKNTILPLSDDYSAKLPIFTSFSNNKSWTVNDSATLQATNKMASFIGNNPFWMAQIQQVDIRANDVFEIIPTIGDHLIIFGDTTDLENKFKKLEKFYKKVSTVVGFDKYAVLNVQFKNQIIASNNYITNIDSVTAESTIQAFLRGNADSTFVTADTNRTVQRNTDTTNRIRNNANRNTRATPTSTQRNATTIRSTTQPRSTTLRQATIARPTANLPRRPATTPVRPSTNNNRNRNK